MQGIGRSFLIAALLTTVLTIDCLAQKSKKTPTEFEAQFAASEKIVVLPAVDSRVGQKASVKLEDIQKQVVNLLKKKNYIAEGVATSGVSGEIIEDDLKEAKPEWVKGLGPAEARYVLVVCLGDVTSKMTFGSTGNAEVSGYLYDKQDFKLIWKEKGVGQAGQGGLAGMMLKGMMKGEAMRSAIYDLMSRVPERPKAKKK